MAPTHEDWARMRYEYECTDKTVPDIAADGGVSTGTLRDRVRRWNWTRRRAPIPRHGPPPPPLVPQIDHRVACGHRDTERDRCRVRCARPASRNRRRCGGAGRGRRNRDRAAAAKRGRARAPRDRADARAVGDAGEPSARDGTGRPRARVLDPHLARAQRAPRPACRAPSRRTTTCRRTSTRSASSWRAGSKRLSNRAKARPLTAHRLRARERRVATYSSWLGLSRPSTPLGRSARIKDASRVESHRAHPPPRPSPTRGE